MFFFFFFFSHSLPLRENFKMQFPKKNLACVFGMVGVEFVKDRYRITIYLRYYVVFLFKKA